MQQVVLGIDLGGTKIAGALVDRNGQLENEMQTASRADLGGAVVLARLLQFAQSLLKKAREDGKEVAAIGVGSAGEIDYRTGVVTYATDNIPGWSGTDIKGRCETEFGIPTFVDNDGNAGALGEKLFGAGRDVEDFVYLSIGTGIGGGIVSRGQLLRGTSNCAGALGHISIDYEGLPCNCGSVGCLEAYVSGPAIRKLATCQFKLAGRVADSSRNGADRLSDDSVGAERLFQLAREGDPIALELVERIGKYLGWGLVSIVNMLNPKLVIIGGGVSQGGDMLLAPARKVVQERALPGIARQVAVKTAGLGPKAGVVGAGSLAWQGLKEELVIKEG